LKLTIETDSMQYILVRYFPFWNIIDERLDKQLHKPLHVTYYLLNSQMRYCLGFKAYLEVKQGLMESLTRMVKDKDEQTLIDIQIDVS